VRLGCKSLFRLFDRWRLFAAVFALALAAQVAPAFAQADVRILKSGPDVVAPGEEFEYTIRVENISLVANSDPLLISDQLPPGVQLLGIDPGPGPSGSIGCTDDSNNPPLIICNAFGIVVGEPGYTITIFAQLSENAEPGTEIDNTAEVADDDGGSAGCADIAGCAADVNLANNASTHTITVAGPDLTIAKSHNTNAVRGQPVTYTIQVTNLGSAATVAPTTVTDTLPAGLTAISLSGAGWNCTLATLTCVFPGPTPAGNGESPITLVAMVDNNAPNTVVNTATVTGPVDVNPGNNTAMDQTAVSAAGVGLSLGISFSSPTYYAVGQNIGVSYLVTNVSGATVSTIAVTDAKVPAITCPATTLAGGASMTCTGTYIVTPGDIATGVSPFTATVNGSGGANASATGAITLIQFFIGREFVETRAKLLNPDPPGLHDRIGSASGSITETGGNVTLNFAASALVGAGEAATALATGSVQPPVKLWIDGKLTLHSRNTGGGGFALVGLGGDYLVNEDLLVGAALYIDWMSDTTTAGRIAGVGYLAGPYVSAAITRNITFDGALFFGGSSNDVAVTMMGIPLTGTFTTHRWLARGELDGQFGMGNFVVRPDATMYLLHEVTGDYTVRDHLGNLVGIAGFTTINVNLSGGALVERPIELENGLTFIPRAGVRMGVTGSGPTVVLNDPYGTALIGFILEGDNWKVESSIEGSLYASSLRQLAYKAGISGEF
jgi:uncharacterized repeat protein (TIGR01451 family)